MILSAWFYGFEQKPKIFHLTCEMFWHFSYELKLRVRVFKNLSEVSNDDFHD